MTRAYMGLLTLWLLTLGGCAANQMDPASLTPVTKSNVLKPEFTVSRAGTAHVTLYRLPANMDTRCDATVQVSFHDVPGGRVADVAKMWPLDRLDLYLDPGHYRLNIYSGICSNVLPVDADMDLKADEAITYRLFTGMFNMTLDSEPRIQ